MPLVCLYLLWSTPLDFDKFSEEIKNKEGVIVGRGQGNHVSVEFNVLYRVSSILCWCYFFTSHGSF